jgi:hypothetical protein
MCERNPTLSCASKCIYDRACLDVYYPIFSLFSNTVFLRQRATEGEIEREMLSKSTSGETAESAAPGDFVQRG